MKLWETKETKNMKLKIDELSNIRDGNLDVDVCLQRKAFKTFWDNHATALLISKIFLLLHTLCKYYHFSLTPVILLVLLPNVRMMDQVSH